MGSGQCQSIIHIALGWVRVHGPTSLCRVSEDFPDCSRLECSGVNPPGSISPTGILGNWGINIQAPSPWYGIIIRHVLFHSPGFSYGIKLQLPTVVAAPAHVVLELPKHTHCPWIPVSRSASGRTHSQMHAVEKGAQGLKVEELASSWLCTCHML